MRYQDSYSIIPLYLIITLLFGCSLLIASEQESMSDPETLEIVEQEEVPSTVDIRDLTSFIDGYVERMTSDYEPPGMIVSVVIGEQQITKGYGIADMASGRLNDEKTLFRIGSISKLFVWLSAHILADEGKLDLDADINEYLEGYATKGTFNQPITMRDLMAHRPGFDDNIKDFLDPDRDVSLEEAVMRLSPLRVAAPGERTSYSNTGTNIAAYIVERVSGQSFYDFVEQRILQPVGLNSITLRDPETGKNDPALEARIAKPHKMENGIAVTMNYLAVRPQEPVGAVAMDAENAAIFMRMLLNKTQYEGGRLMSEEAWMRITQPAFEDEMGSDNMGWGFMLNSVDGFETVGHGGATKFLSWMFVIPELEMGVFISSNMANANTRAEQLAWSIVRRVTGTGTLQDFMAIPGRPDVAKKIAGDYMNNRRPQERGVSIGSLGLDFQIRATEDGFLIFPGASETRYAPISDDIWVSKKGHRIRIVRDSYGNVLRIHGSLGSATVERINFIDTTKPLAIGFGGVLFFSVMALLGMYYRHGRARNITNTGIKLGWINISSVVMWFSFFILLALVMGEIANLELSEIDNVPFPPISVTLLFLAINVLCIQVIIHALSLIPAWIYSGWTVIRKINYTLYGLFASFSLYLFYHWKLIGGTIYGL